jgi:hypothetical protein
MRGCETIADHLAGDSIVKILVSVISLAEARAVVELDADIIDIKNPAEGSLGAQPPDVIREIAEGAGPRRTPVSVTLGDLPFKPGTAALAAFGAAHLPVAYLKVGLHGARTHREALAMLRAVGDAVQLTGQPVSIAAVGYADHRRFDGLAPHDLVLAAHDAGCAVAMLDTAIKDGLSLFDVMGDSELEEFVGAARQANLQVALAGSLSHRHLPALRSLRPDIIGVRGAVCRASDREGRIDPEAAREFIRLVRASVGPA